MIVSALYDFSGSGLGTFTFDPVSRFQAIGVNDTVEATSGTTPIVTANVRSVSITIADDVSKRELKLEKRSTAIYCSDDDLSIVNTSVTEARSMAATAGSYIKNHGDKDQLYKDYFGTNSKKTVMGRFDLIFNVDSSPDQINLSCWSTDGKCAANQFAYTDFIGIHDVERPGIYYCDPFWKQRSVKGIKDFCKDKSDYAYRGGTTLRMLAGMLFAAEDPHPTACDKAIMLNNDQKINNARNYEVGIQTPSGLPRAWC